MPCFSAKVRYVGHIISADGIETDGIETRQDSQNLMLARTQNVDELRTFLGFTGYYRRFVEGYSIIAKPLNMLLAGIHNKKKSRRKVRIKDEVSIKWKWEEAQQTAFNTLKYILTSPPILSYPDYTQPFIVHTDACASGLGAVLYQTKDDKERVISYASRGISPAEQRYPAHKLEFLALKWAITSKFHDYLYSNSFVVYTDNNPMTYVLNKAKLDATSHRWVAALSAYDFRIKYRPGKANADADALSRMPQCDDQGYCEVEPNSVKALCQIHTSCYVTSLAMSATVSEDLDLHGDVIPRDWRKLQYEDPMLRVFVKAVQSRKPLLSEVTTVCVQVLLHEFRKLVLKRGVLYRRIEDRGEVVLQLVLPETFRQQAMESAHEHMGHLGRDKLFSVLRERVYWPRCTKDVETYLKSCEHCIKRKSPTDVKVPMVSITSSQPLELVTMDYLTLEASKGGFEHLLVITDHFTKYAMAVPTRNQTAKVTADALYNNCVAHYGFPRRLHSDQGANFESTIIKELCAMAGVTKSRTTPYNPSGNGITEHMNRTLLGMLGTLQPDQKHDWKARINHLVHAYNCCRHDTTGYSPYQLMFGRQPRLAVDVVIGLVDEEVGQQSYTSYATKVRHGLKAAYELASNIAKRAQQRQKDNHDLKARAAILEVGDRVLVKWLAFQGKHKIADRWEDFPYIVLEQPNSEIPVYIVKREDRGGLQRTLHRKHLLPIGSLPLTRDDQIQSNDAPVVPAIVRPKPAPRCTKAKPVPVPLASDPDGDSQDDDDFGYMVTETYQFENPVPANREQIVPRAGDLLHEAEADDSHSSDGSLSDEDVAPVSPVVDIPRRSGRNRRPPQRFEQYDMFSVFADAHKDLLQ